MIQKKLYLRTGEDYFASGVGEFFRDRSPVAIDESLLRLLVACALRRRNQSNGLNPEVLRIACQMASIHALDIDEDRQEIIQHVCVKIVELLRQHATDNPIGAQQTLPQFKLLQETVLQQAALQKTALRKTAFQKTLRGIADPLPAKSKARRLDKSGGGSWLFRR